MKLEICVSLLTFLSYASSITIGRIFQIFFFKYKFILAWEQFKKINKNKTKNPKHVCIHFIISLFIKKNVLQVADKISNKI